MAWTCTADVRTLTVAFRTTSASVAGQVQAAGGAGCYCSSGEVGTAQWMHPETLALHPTQLEL